MRGSNRRNRRHATRTRFDGKVEDLKRPRLQSPWWAIRYRRIRHNNQGNRGVYYADIQGCRGVPNGLGPEHPGIRSAH